MMVSSKNPIMALKGCSQVSRSLQRLSYSRPLLVAQTIEGSKRYTSTQATRDDGDSLKSLAESFVPELATHARAVPVSPSYFSRQPSFTDKYLTLHRLLRSYEHLPVTSKDQAERVAWKSLDDYRLAIGEHVKTSDFSKCLQLIKRLHLIHPKLRPKDVNEALAEFKRDIQPFSNVAKPIPIDRFGRALGVGRRKSSVARAWVVEGTGEVLVNGKSLADVFGRVHDRESALWALQATGRLDKYNVWAQVEGGGTTGQAEALTLAVAKALMAHEPALKPALRRAGCVTRDSRRVERKKHGHVKARKMPTWVKR
ncbi:hypothetical protein VTK73DRAFT_8137 [Phialemonium thermophilum]|uniref:Small ribosomal subunit protein uS9m n=1 Tax=Phialemonium thermophilum TaxID=223376 RepID=A0ABR3XQ33_9PEZI